MPTREESREDGLESGQGEPFRQDGEGDRVYTVGYPDNGVNESNETSEITQPSETSPPATPTEPLNHIVGRPFPPGYKGPRRPRPGTELQLRYRKLVWKIVTAAEWEKTVRTMLEVSQNPANRQCVAAASWIADRVMGPVAALMQLDVTSGGESLEDKRQALLARFAELYGVAGPVVDALPAPDEEQIPPDSP